MAEQGRNAAYGAVNAVMIETYWRIGQRIMEQEQKGKERAEYGTQLIEMLSEELTKHTVKVSASEIFSILEVSI